MYTHYPLTCLLILLHFFFTYSLARSYSRTYLLSCLLIHISVSFHSWYFVWLVLSNAIPGIVVIRRLSHYGYPYLLWTIMNNPCVRVRIQAISKNITRYNSADWTCPWSFPRPCRTFTVFIYRGRCRHTVATCTYRILQSHTRFVYAYRVIFNERESWFPNLIFFNKK